MRSEVPEGLKELVSSQNNLKYLKLLKLLSYYERNCFADIMPALTKHSNALTKLHLYGHGIDDQQLLSFVPFFLNLQEIGTPKSNWYS